MELVETQSNPLPAQHRFQACLARAGQTELHRRPVSTLQVNVGKLCNQACKHCHVEAGPKRTEIMTWEVMERIIALAAQPAITTVDLTGGAPEMNPHFRRLVEQLQGLDKELIIRCNLTIVEEPGYSWLPEFYAANRARLICSLPCHGPENVAMQRGKGIFEKSISALHKLNAVGYAAPDGSGGLILDLVYNPVGPFLPPDQTILEADYREALGGKHGVFFNQLLTLTNLPIGRFRQSLSRQGQLAPYLDLLDEAFNAGTIEHLMCRDTLSIGYDGKIYDCDFNQMLEMEIDGGRISILDPDFRLDDLGKVAIATGEHCLGCTAGAGSSCGGALTG
jgi:radical SAM/Cys-rich protein